MCEKANRALLQKEAYRLSELSLASDSNAASVADQRANGFSGMSLAGAAILTGLFDEKTPNVGLLGAAALMVVAAAIAAYSARPQKFYFPGARFDDFDPDFASNTSYEDAIEELARYNDKHSRYNRDVLQKNSLYLTASYVVAVLGLLVGIGFQLSSLE